MVMQQQYPRAVTLMKEDRSGKRHLIYRIVQSRNELNSVQKNLTENDTVAINWLLDHK